MNTEQFLNVLTEKKAAPFSAVEFFKEADFVKAIDLSSTKLASMDLKPSNSVNAAGWGLDVPKQKLNMPKLNPVDSFQMPESNKIMQQKPNNPTGFQGMTSTSAKGNGFNAS